MTFSGFPVALETQEKLGMFLQKRKKLRNSKSLGKIREIRSADNDFTKQVKHVSIITKYWNKSNTSIHYSYCYSVYNLISHMVSSSDMYICVFEL